MAIGAFGVLDPEERKGLAEAAEEGDEEALGELRAEHLEAIEAMLGALEDPASRKLIELGMTLALTHHGSLLQGLSEFQANGGLGADGEELLGANVARNDFLIAKYEFGSPGSFGQAFTLLLDGVEEQLENILVSDRGANY